MVGCRVIVFDLRICGGWAGDFFTIFATIGAASTLAVGFAMQNVIKNFVSGVFIFLDKPFRIGDWIEWGEYVGKVEDIELRVTKVRTFDGELLTVPNSDLADSPVKNPVDGGKLRIRIDFGIGYEDDRQRASDIILEKAAENDDVLSEPEPHVRLMKLDDSSINLQARIWIDDPERADYIRVRGEFVDEVKTAFEKRRYRNCVSTTGLERGS